MANEEKHAGGRPKKFRDIAELQAMVSAYFNECERKDEPLTVTGLALALDTSREVLMHVERNYEQEFVDTIKRAKLRCENYAEKQIFSGKNAAGPIFALKNHGWQDKREFSGPEGGPIKIECDIDLLDQIKRISE
jgi:hypothetical protein